MRKRFRWTRERYRKAHHLCRLLSRFLNLPDMPPLVQQYIDLWDRHPQRSDPLLTPMRYRSHYIDPDIPF